MLVKQNFSTKSPQSLKLLAWRVKKKSQNMIQELKDAKGDLHTSSKEILQIMASFSLYIYPPTCHLNQLMNLSESHLFF